MSERFKHQSSFTIFLNSASATASSPTSNELLFSFAKPLIKQPDDIAYASLQSFQSYNTFPTVGQYLKNNVVKIINRMYNATNGTYTDYLTRIVIPDDHYDGGSLMAFLNTNCQRQIQVFGANWTSTVAGTSFLYLGLGFSGQNNAAASTPIQGFITDPLDSGRTYIQSGVNTYENAYEKTYTSGSIATDPYVYAGVYLVDDAETHEFMICMGFANRYNPPVAATSGIYGYGYTFPLTINPIIPQDPVRSPYVINLAGPSNLYFTCDELSNNSRHNDPMMDSKSILGTIPVNSYYGQYINFQQQNPVKQMLDELDTMSFVVTIYDQNNKIVDFRGTAWTAEIAIDMASDAQVLAQNILNPDSMTTRMNTKRKPSENPNKILAKVARHGGVIQDMEASRPEIPRQHGNHSYAHKDISQPSVRFRG